MQIARLKIQSANTFAAALEYRLDSVKALSRGRADPGYIFEQAALISGINQHGDREFVGIEVPGKLLGRVEDVGGQTGQWIGVGVKSFEPEAVGEKVAQCRMLEQGAVGSGGFPGIARDKSAGSLQKGVHRMLVRIVGIGLRVKVRIDALGRIVRGLFSGGDFVRHDLQCVVADKAL